MAVSTVRIVQDGIRMQPYLVALARWCISSFWSTATVLIHRLLTKPLPPITAPRSSKPRPASSDHLHAEPLVDCEVLHHPEKHSIDVIFVHGLYGSLANTWRQGEWRNDNNNPQKELLRKHSESTSNLTIRNCEHCDIKCEVANDEVPNDEVTLENDLNILKKTVDLYNVSRISNDFITEKFCRNTLEQVEIVDNYETQAKFVRDLFKNCGCGSDVSSNGFFKNSNSGNEVRSNGFINNSDNRSEVRPNGFLKNSDSGSNSNGIFNNSECESSATSNGMFNNSEISINGFLKGSERDDIISNGCLNNSGSEVNSNGVLKSDSGSEVTCLCNQCEVGCGCLCDKCYSACWPKDWIPADFPGARIISINYTSDPYLWRLLWVKKFKRLRLHERAEQMTSQLLDLGVGERPIVWVGHSKGGLFIKQIYCEGYEAYTKLHENAEISAKSEVDYKKYLLDNSEELHEPNNETKYSKVPDGLRATLWEKSAGFMFYSVPHRGSPLADIKTPFTARSIELLEICKDCALVLSLQDRWLAATSAVRPVVHSLVETCRTLMSVLWLRIVSVDSADPGIGSLYGISVDHRQICKPTSRHCVLYTDLMNLMHSALTKYNQI